MFKLEMVQKIADKKLIPSINSIFAHPKVAFAVFFNQENSGILIGLKMSCTLTCTFYDKKTRHEMTNKVKVDI